MRRRPPKSPPSPHTTLLRSHGHPEREHGHRRLRRQERQGVRREEGPEDRVQRSVFEGLTRLRYVEHDLQALLLAVLLGAPARSEEHTSELQSRLHLVFRPLL